MEKVFKLSKSYSHGYAVPIYHWTDFKMKCQFFCYIAAYTYLRILKLKLKQFKINKSIEDIIAKMKWLRSTELKYMLPNREKITVFKLANIDEEHIKIVSMFNCIFEYCQLKYI